MDFGTLPLTDPMENRPLARCQSLSLTDVLEPLSDVDNNSINSEPAYILVITITFIIFPFPPVFRFNLLMVAMSSNI